MERYKSDMNKVIKWINWGLLGFAVFLLACIAIIVLGTLFTTEIRLQPSIDGIKNMLNFWAEYAALIKLSGYTLTLLIASYNLSKYLDIETANALSKLRKMLNSTEKKKIHYYLLDDEDKNAILPEIDKAGELNCELSNVELLDYIGIIELGAIMLKRKIITTDEFYNQFGYRAENLWKNNSVKEHIKKYPRSYKDFNYIVKQLNM